MLNLRRDNFLLQALQNPLPSAIVKPTVAGEIPSARSIVRNLVFNLVTSTTSATSLLSISSPEITPPTTLHALNQTGG